MKQHLHTAWLIVLFPALLSLGGCYYDIEEDLYPQVICDTVPVLYSGKVQQILQSNCLVCHNSTTNSGNIVLENYAGLRVYIDNGKLWGAIRHSPGFSPMPKSGGKLSPCDIQAIGRWIDSGAPNN
jgi:mono/diheme cytochrome c family protein